MSDPGGAHRGYGFTLTGFCVHGVDREVDGTAPLFRHYPKGSVWATSRCGSPLVNYDESAVAKKGIVNPIECSVCKRKAPTEPVAPEAIASALYELLDMARVLVP